MNMTEIMADLSPHTPMMQQYLKGSEDGASTFFNVLSHGRFLPNCFLMMLTKPPNF